MRKIRIFKKSVIFAFTIKRKAETDKIQLRELRLIVFLFYYPESLKGKQKNIALKINILHPLGQGVKKK